MSWIEAALRGGAVVLLVLLVALLLRDARRVPAGIFAGLFAAGAAAYTIVSASFFAPVQPLSLLPLPMPSMRSGSSESGGTGAKNDAETMV